MGSIKDETSYFPSSNTKFHSPNHKLARVKIFQECPRNAIASAMDETNTRGACRGKAFGGGCKSMHLDLALQMLRPPQDENVFLESYLRLAIGSVLSIMGSKIML